MEGITKKDLEKLAQGEDLVRVEKKIDGLIDRVNETPTREEFPELLKTALDFVTLKAEHERMKKIIHEKLGVEV